MYWRIHLVTPNALKLLNFYGVTNLLAYPSGYTKGPQTPQLLWGD